MNIIQDFIPAGRNNRPGTKIFGPRYITIHDTANPAAYADAIAHAAYLQTTTAANKPVSWHFSVDDTRIVQHLPLGEHGWHAGDGSGTGNLASIGIEICENADGNRTKAEANAAWLIAHLMQETGLGINVVEQHNRWSGKDCPRIIRARKGGWEGFIAEVERNMEAPKTETIVSPIEPWKQKIMDAAMRNGLIHEPHDPNEKADKWFVLATVLNMLGQVTGKDPYL